METYNGIIKIIDANLIYCLVPLLLTIILIEALFKNKFKTKLVLNLIGWFIILYSALSMIYFLIVVVFFSDGSAFLNRATGPYRLMYWLMLLCSSVLPFTLFYKKWRLRPFYLLLVAIFIKAGWYFERFVIIVTRFHRDYAPDNEHFDWYTLLGRGILMLTLQGFILAIVMLGIFELIERKKA